MSTISLITSGGEEERIRERLIQTGPSPNPSPSSWVKCLEFNTRLSMTAALQITCRVGRTDGRTT